MNKLLTKIVGVALGATMAVGVGLAAAKGVDARMQRAEAGEEVYKTALFGAAYNSASVTSYSGSFSSTNNGFTVDLVNWNNNANKWSYVKAGHKNTAYVGTITTHAAIDVAVTKVAITIDAIVADLVNSVTLSTSSNGTDWTSAGTFTEATGAQTVTLASPAENLYYKIAADCSTGGSANGHITVSKVEYYYNNSGPSLSVSPESVVVSKNGTETLTATTGGASGYASWESSDPSVASLGTPSNNTVVVTGHKQGTTKITASFSTANPVEIPVRVVDPQHAGTENDPYTPEDAIDSIILETGVTNVYATGIVSRIVDPYSSQHGNITFDISSDGETTSEQLRGYRTVGTTDYPIDSSTSVQVGDIVTLYGSLTVYNGTYEFASGNELVYLERPVIPTIEIDQGTQALEIGDTVNLTVTTTGAEGVTVVWASSEGSVASIDQNGLVTALTEGSTSISATITVRNKDYSDSITVNVSEPQTPVIEVGDQVLIYSGTYFLTGFDSSYGTAGSENDALVFDVCAGTNNKTFAFENNGVYLSWSSGNSLTTSNEINSNSSWTAFGDSMSSVTIANVGTPERILQFNSSANPKRFACYTGTQANACLKTYDPSSVKELSSLRVEGTPDKTTYNAGEAFVSTGLTVYAVFTDSTTYPDEIVTNSVVWGELVAGATSVTGSYTYDGITKSCTITGLTINAYVAPTYTLITDVSQLKVGDSVAIVASGADYAMSTTQNNNNRGQASVTKDLENNTATLTADVQIFAVEAGTVDGSFAFNTGNGYIYAASSSSNHLKTEAEKSANSSFSFAITEGNAILTAQGANTRNVIQYNSSSSIFACYGSASQGGVQIYRDASQPEPTPVDEFVAEFLSSLSTGANAVCDAQGNTDLDELKETWALLALEFDDLDPTDKALFVDGEASESGTDFQKALALYDYIAAKYNTSLEGPDLDDYNFMGRSITPSGNNRINPMNTANSTVAIIVVATISVISVSALGAYFLLRKKKEER